MQAKLKVIISSLLFLTLTGCQSGVSENQNLNSNISQIDVPEGDHYVRVVIPEADKSPGTTVTINMPPREPYTYQFAEDLDITNPDERLHVFNLEAPLQPATMTVNYNNDESHTMSQVVFDTTIETP